MERAGRRPLQPLAARRRRDPQDQPGELHRREGRGRPGARGYGRHLCGVPRRSGLEGLPLGPHRGRRDVQVRDIAGRGAIQHIWLTPTGRWREQVLRIYWDDDPQPAVECPLGDFFAGLGQVRARQQPRRVRQPGLRVQLLLGDAVPRTCPHHPHQRGRASSARLYYQVAYSLCDVPEDARVLLRAVAAGEPPAGQARSCTILDGVRGRGHYVGTYSRGE